MEIIMKKILLVVLFSILFVSVVNAETNKLYFTTTGDRIYYDSSLFDEDIFINHTDMIPGSQFEDTLVIENGTHVDYNVYFRIVEREQNENAIKLLKNVSMKIYLDEQLLYEGDATGLADYNGVDFQASGYKYKPASTHNFVVTVAVIYNFPANNKEGIIIDY